MAADIDVAAADRLLTTTRAVRRRLDLDREAMGDAFRTTAERARRRGHDPTARACLELRPRPSQVALLPVAYSTGDTFSPADRPPPQPVTHWDGWGSS